MPTATGKTGREPIQKGQVLPLQDFLHRTNMKYHAWNRVKKQAAKMGIILDLRQGRQCFVDSDQWVEFLNRSNAS